MEDVIQRAELVAETKSTVLITGETGTGKELVARAIHDRSAQRDMPLIKVNCAAIPETLLESELFGHVRGAFTGATTTKKGKFALADGGTIFLDEIGTMSPTLQAKLLRVLQEREFEPLGSERTEKVDVRVIAATNRDLRQMVADGKFQEDLFYRLNVIPIEIPPLRERRDDIPALVEHFVQKHAQRTGRRIERLDDGVLAGAAAVRLAGQRPRAREHDRARRRAVAGPGDHARAPSRCSARRRRRPTGLPSLKLRQNIEWVERETIRRALESAGGVKKDAAELMGISQRALSYYLAKYRLESSMHVRARPHAVYATIRGPSEERWDDRRVRLWRLAHRRGGDGDSCGVRGGSSQHDGADRHVHAELEPEHARHPEQHRSVRRR